MRDDLRHNLATHSRTARDASNCSASQSAHKHRSGQQQPSSELRAGATLS